MNDIHQVTPSRTGITASALSDVQPPARLTLKLDRRPSGVVDGAWWPHSRVLVEELPELVACLDDRIGPVSRVGYSLVTWPAAPRRAILGGRIVRLGGFFSVPADVIDLFGPRGRVSLLVIPPGTVSLHAHRALERAASAGNTDDAETLLRASFLEADDDRTSASNRWETDGGMVLAATVAWNPAAWPRPREADVVPADR